MRLTTLLVTLLLAACHTDPSRCGEYAPNTDTCDSAQCPDGQACKNVGSVPDQSCTCDEAIGEYTCVNESSFHQKRECAPIPDQTSCPQKEAKTSCVYDIDSSGCLSPTTCTCYGVGGFACPSSMYCDASSCSREESDCGGVCKFPSR